MGNCQAAEAATVVIQHPDGNKVERIYWSVSANEVMASNPGHYVALVLTSPATKVENNATVKQLKLLRPDDTLLIGQVYRLISFVLKNPAMLLDGSNYVLKEFAAKKCVKLGKLLKERGAYNNLKRNKKQSGSGTNSDSKSAITGSMKIKSHELNCLESSSGSNGGSRGGLGRHHGGGGGGQWRPALHSIAELGS